MLPESLADDPRAPPRRLARLTPALDARALESSRRERATQCLGIVDVDAYWPSDRAVDALLRAISTHGRASVGAARLPRASRHRRCATTVDRHRQPRATPVAPTRAPRRNPAARLAAARAAVWSSSRCQPAESRASRGNQAGQLAPATIERRVAAGGPPVGAASPIDARRSLPRSRRRGGSSARQRLTRPTYARDDPDPQDACRRASIEPTLEERAPRCNPDPALRTLAARQAACRAATASTSASAAATLSTRCGGHRVVVRVRDREAAAAAGHRAQVDRVAQHLRRRHERDDLDLAAADRRSSPGCGRAWR